LSRPQRACFEEHLAECPDCVAYLATYQKTARLGRVVCVEEHESVAANVPEELLKAILSAWPQAC